MLRQRHWMKPAPEIRPAVSGANIVITSIIDTSLRDRFLVVVATLVAVAVGLWALQSTPLDAIPDLSDVQVIIFTDYPGQAPQVVEDQVTYPLTTAMLAVPRSRVVRGYSVFGLSLVYVIFQAGTDPYWARSRVLEYLSSLSSQLPAVSRSPMRTVAPAAGAAAGPDMGAARRGPPPRVS